MSVDGLLLAAGVVVVVEDESEEESLERTLAKGEAAVMVE